MKKLLIMLCFVWFGTSNLLAQGIPNGRYEPVDCAMRATVVQAFIINGNNFIMVMPMVGSAMYLKYKYTNGTLTLTDNGQTAALPCSYDRATGTLVYSGIVCKRTSSIATYNGVEEQKIAQANFEKYMAGGCKETQPPITPPPTEPPQPPQPPEPPQPPQEDNTIDWQSIFSDDYTYNNRFSYWSALVSADAYSNDYNALSNLGFKSIKTFTSGDLHVLCGIKKVTSFNDGIEYIFAISFRGSVNIVNWIRNFTFNPSVILPSSSICKPTSICEAHTGFLNGIATLLAKRNEIEQYYRTEGYPDFSLVGASKVAYWISGHSLGGALAELLTLKVIGSRVKPKNVICYTFAAPPVGSKTLYSYAECLGVTARIHKVMNEHDIVPTAGVNAYSLSAQHHKFKEGKNLVWSAIFHGPLTSQHIADILKNHSIKETYIQYVKKNKNN